MLEKATQNSVIQTFKDKGWDHIGSNMKYSGTGNNTIISNMYTQLARLNKDVLEHRDFTDREIVQLENAIRNNRRGAFLALRNGVTIILENNKKETIKFIDQNDFKNNSFQIADEVIVVGSETVIMDLLVLINGIPISEIEFKKIGLRKSVDSAINQINRYVDKGAYSNIWMKFIQIFVVSDSVHTKYFASDPREDVLKYGSQAFTWMDEKNKVVNKIEPFIAQFFTIDVKKDFHVKETKGIIFTLFNYMLMNRDSDGNMQTIIMRPPQIHGSKAIVESFQRGMNCYVSASTGSGKTLTMFKTSEILQALGKKLILLFDRKDLNFQTNDQFKGFDTTGRIGEIKKGKDLVKALNDDSETLILTTIQSYEKAIKNTANKAIFAKLSRNKNVVMMFDECHRSVSGSMFASIKRIFSAPKTGKGAMNALFVGFTGTPIVEENSKDNNSQTQFLFGEVVHNYNITEAIRDNAVLPFLLSHIEVKASHDVKPDRNYYANPLRIKKNCEEIVKNLKKHTKQLDPIKDYGTIGFSAMLATDGIENARSYYSNIQPELDKQNRKTSIVFSVNPNDEVNRNEANRQSQYQDIMKQHDTYFGTAYYELSKKDFSASSEAYNADVIKRFKKGEIDLLIVSDMLLTGFDAPKLNTIYIDKYMEYHNLLQAVSRTNRLHGNNKEFGNIVFFSDRNLEPKLKEAIQLFGTATAIEEVIKIAKYSELEKELRQAVTDLRNLVSSADNVHEIDTVKQLREVNDAYNLVNKNLSRIRSYPEWNEADREADEFGKAEKNGYSKIGIDLDELDLFYANINLMKQHLIVTDPNMSNDDLIELDFEVTTVQGKEYGFKYITELLWDFVASPPDMREKWLNECLRAIEDSQDDEVVLNAEALRRVFEACKNDEIQTKDELFERLREEQQKVRREKVENIAKTHNISALSLDNLINYSMQRQEVANIEEILTQTGVQLVTKRREIRKDLKELLGM